MGRLYLIAFFLFSYALVSAQTGFRTVVPREPLVVGESFQVQYVLEDGGTTESIKAPSFPDFRLVSGPSFYKGSIVTMDGVKPLSNAVFTLEALKPGRFMVRGATVQIGDKRIRSNDAEVIVLPGDEAVLKKGAPDDYFLRPGEDAYKKIRENLFIKVQVDRRTCYVGEPVLATFKLYSRLQSRSDIIKNPGFYGFSVYDLVNLADKQSSVENIGGKLFDVHTIRKLQLFPLQAGTLYIDEMEVRNRVEFSRSALNKKTEQEIVEGMMGFPEEELPGEGTEIFESEMHSEIVTVTVKPLPEENRPADHGSAVGQFRIEAALSAPSISSTREGSFIITIRGQGNFIQIDPPKPDWPAGMEVFEPRVSDVFDKAGDQLRGERSFNYPFVVSGKGDFNIPALNFHYFNPANRQYETIATGPVHFSVNPSGLLPPVIAAPATPSAGSGLFVFLGAMAAVFALVFLLYWRKKKQDRAFTKEAVEEYSLVDRLLARPLQKINAPDPQFYSDLMQAIWKFFELKAGLTGTGMSRQALFTALQMRHADQSLLADLDGLLRTCEAGMFTRASLQLDKDTILEKSREVLQQAEKLF